ncbi:hypothetical protein ACJ73_05500 [Blastomyces percursus]|uniref:Myb-like domain-containing protein n=1 Tax=Blastomyces percursus TaxID=1658174 RepID=A0A1J9R566_9EURO|nr:hypothetical protein ACJ73_05500 [Blastomyces percursus]
MSRRSRADEQVSLSTRSPSMGALEDTPCPERAPQTERVNIHERAVGDSQSQVATTDAAGDTGSKTRGSESLGYEGLGAEQPSAGRDGRGNRGPADYDRGASRASYHYEDWNDDWDSENGQAVDGLNTTRKGSVPSQRPPVGNFWPASEAQEVFGRGILRIQPHGHRNAYIFTFLPDVVEAAPKSSASELCEESSTSTGRGPTNPTNTFDSVPGAQKHLPIDPLILADDGRLEPEDLHQPFSLWDDPKSSEAICSYPDPSPPLDQRDSIRPRQGEDTQSTSSPSVAVGNPPSRESPTSAHGGKQFKSRKRKPCRLDGRPPKRVLGPHTSSPGGNPSAPLYTYLQSLPLDKRLQLLQLLSLLSDDSPPHYMPTPDLLGCEPHGSPRNRMPYLSEERDLLLKLRRDEKRPWSEVIRLFSDQFPGRSRGAIRVFWYRILKEGAV